MVLDDALEGRIATILERLTARWPDLDQDAVRAGNRKQAMVPEGATVLEPVGTAPGVIVSVDAGPTVVVLPGPPRELQPMWAAALETPAMKEALAGAGVLERGMLRIFGIPESEIARTLEVLGPPSSLEITTCLRRGEIEIATVFTPDAASAYAEFAEGIKERHDVFSDDESTVDDQVAALLAGSSIATAESCTGGLLAGRLTERAGSSAYVLGGLVVYSNEAKTALAGVPAELIARAGARCRTRSRPRWPTGPGRPWARRSGVGITGIAGPGGGTEDKPVGTVCFSVSLR